MPGESGLLLMQKNYITQRVYNETKYKADEPGTRNKRLLKVTALYIQVNLS